MSEGYIPPGVVLSRDGRFSDLKLVCQGREFKVDKRVVCDKSPVITAACEGGFKESVDNIIHVTEFDAETVDLMLEFLYTGDFDQLRGAPPKLEPVDDSSNSTTEAAAAALKEIKETLLRHVRVNSIADYYDISSLKQAANTKIQCILDEAWFAEGFSEIISEAFNSTSDEALHEIIIATTAKRIYGLIELPDFAALELMNDFTITLLDEILSSHRDELKKLTLACDSHRSQTHWAMQWAATHKNDVQTVKSMRDNEKKRSQRALQSFDTVRVSLASTSSCQNRHCNAAFNCFIEREDCPHGTTHPMFTLRCLRCGLIHNEPRIQEGKTPV